MSRLVSYHLLSEIELCDELENSLQTNVLHLLDDCYNFLLANPFLEVESAKFMELIHLSVIKLQSDVKYLFKKEVSILFPSIRNGRICVKGLDCFNSGYIFKQIDDSHQSIVEQLKKMMSTIQNLVQTNSNNSILLLFQNKMKTFQDAVLHLIYIEQTYLFTKFKNAVNG